MLSVSAADNKTGTVNLQCVQHSVNNITEQKLRRHSCEPHSMEIHFSFFLKTND